MSVDIGIDLGTASVLVYVRGKGVVLKEPSVVAFDRDTNVIKAIGEEARLMLGRTPGNIVAVRPLRQGVISDYTVTEKMIKYFVRKSLGKRTFKKPRISICVPSGVTEVEKKAFYDLVMHSEAKAKSVRIVERGLADAVGLGLDVMNETGIFIANFGGGTTELSVLSRGGMVMNRLLKTGGETLDAAIAGRVRRNREFLIGKSTAERLRKEFAVFEDGTADAKRVYGRDLTSGVPAHTEIQISLVRAAVKEPLEECAEAIRSMLTRTPPDVRRAIEARGIYLTGGVAGLKGFPTYLGERTGLKVFTVPDPELCAVKGLQKIILDKEYYKKLSYSMLDQNYRWLR